MSNELNRKSIDFELPYVDGDGEHGVKKIHVDFISMRILDKYNQLMHRVAKVIEIYQKINNTKEDIGSSLVDNVEYNFNEDGSIDAQRLTLKEKRKKYRDLQKQYKQYTDELEEMGKNDFDLKWELILLILKKNQITDTDLRSKDWWMDCVDSHYIMAFIEASCTKDDNVELKKKQWT